MLVFSKEFDIEKQIHLSLTTSFYSFSKHNVSLGNNCTHCFIRKQYNIKRSYFEGCKMFVKRFCAFW